MNVIIVSLVLLGVIGLIAAVLLYGASVKFKVEENPKIAEIEELLPGANCGGCGLTGCHAFAVACAEATSLDNLHCTGGLTKENLEKIAEITGLAASEGQRKVAIVRCQNSCELNPPRNHYDGVRSCAIEASFYQGESDCVYSCLGNGDCVKVCAFGAISIKEGDSVPTVDLDKCTGCGKCAQTCPRKIIDIAADHPGHRRVWVACANVDKGPVAMKECAVSCIGCQKCKKVCTHNAVEITSFLAHIDQEKCVACGDCVGQCPRHSILSANLDAAPLDGSVVEKMEVKAVETVEA